MACKKAANETAGLKLPANFKAIILAQNPWQYSNIVVTPQGGIYVRLAKPVNNKGTLYRKVMVKAVVKNGFGNYGGTGIYIKDGYLYSSSNEEVFRYKLNGTNEVITPGRTRKIVTVSSAAGSMEQNRWCWIMKVTFINIGAYLNSCQKKTARKVLWE